jgi:outer membrane protein OmpA-like peptidoglycan-associated protein
MHKSFIALIPLFVVACAHAPTDDLVSARRTYQKVANGPTNEQAPAEVYEAKKALMRAERAHEKDPGSNHERDLAYVALRRAELAMARADMKQAEAKAEAAKARHLAMLEEQRDASRAELEQAEGQLSQSQEALEQAQRERQQLEQRLLAATKSLEGMAKLQQEPDRTLITLNGAVLFKHNSADLLPIARERLREVALVLKEYGDGNKIVIEGHTDSRGKDEYNRQLSEKRAMAVRDYLVSEGVSETVVTAVGRGESEPIASNDSADGRANNRRVEIEITKSGDALSEGGQGGVPGGGPQRGPGTSGIGGQPSSGRAGPQ